ncbi:hypothetical protein [uncultured Pontibacter sp.]|uniref:hypothetical protein n=1 Tax=uncultured Pontibacter sp. TaxID=453356 RepID=UPI00262BCDF0|nr:hypothetical protein [uncultured Pontibacter sp.]
MKSYKDLRFNRPDLLTQVYDKDKITVGSLIRQVDNTLTPMPMALARPMEASVAIAGLFPFAIEYDEDTQYVFLVDGATATTNRRVIMYEFNKHTSSYIWKGFITVLFPVTGNVSARGLRLAEYHYTTGQVTASGTTVTGVGTNWKTAGFSVGSRIGFGTIDHRNVTAWYEITSIESDNQLTLNKPVVEEVAGQPFTIEEVRVIMACSNSVTTNGGLFVIKGLNYDTFTQAGTTIPAATTIDNIRATYWLADAPVVTNILPGGSAIDEMVDWHNHEVYCTNGSSTTLRVFKYNIRQPLTTLTAGKSVEALVLSTGNQLVTGTLSINNNGRIATANHGAGAGEKSLYFVTNSRLYRINLANITSGSTTYVSDSMTEIPAGGAMTVMAGAVLSSVEYSGVIDSFIVNSSGLGRSYVSKYKTDGSQFDLNFLSDARQIDGSNADSDAPFYPSLSTATFSSWVENGIMHTIRQSAVNTTNQMYAIPIAADYLLSNDQYIITPVFNIPNLRKLDKVYVDVINRIGSERLGVSAEPYNLYYRTSGIDDNTGLWIQADSDMAGVTGTKIQFKFTFRVMGQTCLTARIKGLTVTYEDNNTDSHFSPSNKHTSIQNNVMAYRQVDLFDGSRVPEMTIKLFNVETNILVLADNTSISEFGTWEYSTDAVNWLPFNGNAANRVGNYIRYKALGLPAGIKIKAVLSVS